MGHELARMIRDGAPPGWTPQMVLVALVIADDATDPTQAGPGKPWGQSFITLRGYWRDDGDGQVWRDGLTGRTRMSERAISRALTGLGEAGFEMREIGRAHV